MKDVENSWVDFLPSICKILQTLWLNPHCGLSAVPFINSTTGYFCITSLMKVLAEGGGLLDISSLNFL